jgi:hypothetical protein
MLNGAIQKAARDATMESGLTNQAAIDTKVSDAVQIVVHQATLAFDRKSYASFSDAGRPEDYTDVDGDGTCNNGEPYEDANGNHAWDRDRGLAGQGGARDAVLYTVKVEYSRPFPIASLIGMNPKQTLIARAILRNQPYGMQNIRVPDAGNCA